MRKRIMAMLVVAALAVSLLPTTAFAAATESCSGGDTCTQHAAAIGTTHYDTLVAAVNAANAGETVTLLKDVDIAQENESIPTLKIRKSITLDGGGHSVTTTSAWRNYYNGTWYTFPATLNIGGPDESNRIDVTVKNLTVTNALSDGMAIYTVGDLPSLTLENVEARVTGSGKPNALNVSGYAGDVKTEITIKDSTLTTTNTSYAINVYAEADITIDHSTVSGWAAIYMHGAKLYNGNENVSGGTDGCTVTVQNGSVLSGENIQTSGQNCFTTIVLGGNNITVDVKDSTLETLASGQQDQSIVRFCDVDTHVTGCKLLVSGNSIARYNKNDYDYLVTYDEACKDNNSIVLSGGVFSWDVQKYCASGYTAIPLTDDATGSRYLVTNTSSISLSPATATLTYGGDTTTLTPKVGEETINASAITWTSSNESVATVSNGVVTPVGAGTATITGTLTRNTALTATCSVTVERAASTVTAPTAKTLTYTGDDQELVNAGTAQGGSLVYSLEETGTYTAAIPKGNAAGAYTVWYKVDGGSNYAGTEAASVTVNITNAAFTVAHSGYEGTYDGQDHSITVTAPQDATITYSTDGSTYVSENPTFQDAGSYTVYYKVTKANYNDVEGQETVVIAQAPVSLTITPSSTRLVGGGAVQLTVSGVPDGETVEVTCPDVIVRQNRNGSYIAVFANKTKRYTFTVSHAASTNYLEASATCTVSVNARTSDTTDDTKVEKEVTSDGTVIVTSTAPDGTVTITSTSPEGVQVVTVKTPDGAVTATVTLPEGVSSATVNIPVSGLTAGMVAENAENAEIVKLSVPTEDGMLVRVDSSMELVLVDNSKLYTDVPDGYWAEDEIAFVTARELFEGTGDTTFAPNSAMTRQMVMTVLARLDGQDTDGGATWYEKGMAWAVDKGISDGTNGTASVTREQLVTMLYRYAGEPSTEGSYAEFPDAGQVSSYAEKAMAWAVDNGIIVGSDGKLNPKGYATRAQVAAILMRYCTLLVK